MGASHAARSLDEGISLSLPKRFLCSCLTGLLAGASTTLFLKLLASITLYRENHSWLIGFLPLAGLFIGWLYQKFGAGTQAGSQLIIDQILEPKTKLPFRMAPFIFLSTLITHLFGGSAGREGTAVQMGASLSDQLTSFFKMTPQERRILLISGAGAGFGAAIGAPWAGVFFGMEIVHFRRFKLVGFFECLVASLSAYAVTHFLKAPHTPLPSPQFPKGTALLLAAIVCSFAFGVLGETFVRVTHGTEAIFKKAIRQSIFRPFIGGILLSSFYFWEGSFRFAGLGLEEIKKAFSLPTPLSDVGLKFIFTALTLGSGFKGGEFIPLVFMGAGLGSFLSQFLSASPSQMAALGFAAVFASVSQTPLSCTLMAIELFGWEIAPYAFLACFLSYFTAARMRHFA